MPEFTDDEIKRGLQLLRQPFEAHQVLKLCKSTKKDNPPGRCKDCGGHHKLPSVQLSYVGHAAVTDRLLECDPNWTWEPFALTPDGSPLLDKDGGMWIRLTVCGVTRMGYGDAQGKQGGDAMKERIGDAIRNAAMRFGVALDLWHKGELHIEPEEGEEGGTVKTFGQIPLRRKAPAVEGETGKAQGGGAGREIAAPLPPEAEKIPEQGLAQPLQSMAAQSQRVALQSTDTGQGDSIPQNVVGQPDAKSENPAKDTPSGNKFPKKDRCINPAQQKRLFAMLNKSKRTKEDLSQFLKTFKTNDHPDGIEHSADIPVAVYDVVCAWIEGAK